MMNFVSQPVETDGRAAPRSLGRVYPSFTVAKTPRWAARADPDFRRVKPERPVAPVITAPCIVPESPDRATENIGPLGSRA
jgi:hypothetical protein